MKKILFDCSSHLGQFCTSDEGVRKGCKNMQAGISLREKDDCIGTWTDLENGRTDRTVWNLPEDVQAHYYPIMDRFYSIMNVRQEPLTEAEEVLVMQLKNELPALSLYSRHTCARAITERVDEVHTLIAELLAEDAAAYMSARGVRMVKPESQEEIPYADEVLEQRYQSAMQVFRSCKLDLPRQLADNRVVVLT